MGNSDYGIDPKTVMGIAEQLRDLRDQGLELAVVIGGGNIFRGLSKAAGDMNRATADYMGMLATVMNCMAMLDALERLKIPARVMSAIDMRAISETYTRPRAMHHLRSGRILIFAAGTGNPFFTTDTAAALRAIEVQAEIIMKATKVDGIYTADPVVDPSAVKIDKTTYMEVLAKQLKVMDATAISLCMDNKMPILVFDLTDPKNIVRAVKGERIGTLVEG